MVDAAMTEDDMQRLYQWIDEIPLSRPKRNIGRDFSDGGMLDDRMIEGCVATL